MTSVEAGAVPAPAHSDHAPPSTFARVGQILCIVVPVAIWFAPLDLEPPTKHGFAVVAFMIIA